MSPPKIAYRPKRGARLSRADAQRYGERLRALAGRLGQLTPDVVYEDARDPGSPLHDWFDWDDSTAAEAHRRAQAAYLLRSIEIVYVDREGRPQQLRAFWNIPVERDEEDPEIEEDEPARIFVTTEQVLREEQTRTTVLSQLKARIRWLRKDVEKIEGLSPVTKLLREAEVLVIEEQRVAS